MSNFEFSRDDDILLVEFIKNNNVFYDLSHPKCKDINFKNQLWQEISNKLNKSVKDTKERWKNIVYSFSKRKRKLDMGSTVSNKKKWSLALHLGFLENLENKQETSSNIEPIDNVNINTQNKHVEVEIINVVDNNVDDNLLPNTSTQTINYNKKYKNDQFHKSSEQKVKERQQFETVKSQNENILKIVEDDDVDHFFKSLALSIKKLPSKGISEVKLKMLLALIEIEDKYSAYQSTSAG